ncbi:thioredoxin [Actinoplanes sp. NPDC051411]|uniref:thioredoxin n=1 Tax=Actinoplanes sp. NPDC051411 TaxID=3155522 RepID=UPI00343FB2EA
MATGIVTCLECGRRNRVPPSADGVPRCGNCGHPLPWITEAGDDDFADRVEQAGIPVLVDMWADWCVPCRQVSPALEQLARDRAGTLKLVKVDVDRSPKTAERFSVRAVPTLMLVRQGRVLSRRAGAAPVAALRGWVDEELGSRP